jgi:membrane protein DedA with SNARE-associated domain
MEIFGLLLWAFCFVGSGYLASQKNRSVGAWLVLGFFFGIASLIIVALLPALPKRLEL